MPDRKDRDAPLGIQGSGSGRTIFPRQHEDSSILFQRDRQHHLTVRKIGYSPPVHLHSEGKAVLRGKQLNVKDAVSMEGKSV